MAGVTIASFAPGLSQSLRNLVGLSPGPSGAQPRGAEAISTEHRAPRTEPAEDKQGILKLTEDQVTAAHIDLATVQGGTLAHRITIPGTIVPHADRIARVAVKLSGTVGELRKKIGDPVAKDEILAILESREVAAVLGHGLSPRKPGRNSLIRVTSPVHPVGCTPPLASNRKRAAHQANLQGVTIWAPIDTSQGWPLTDCLLARHGTARSMSGGGRLCWSFQSGGLMVVSLRRFGLFFSTVLPIWWIAAAIAHVAD